MGMNHERIQVILADDHPSVRAGIRLFLERDPGIEVLAECDDGLEALNLVRQLEPDVAVVDLRTLLSCRSAAPYLQGETRRPFGAS